MVAPPKKNYIGSIITFSIGVILTAAIVKYAVVDYYEQLYAVVFFIVIIATGGVYFLEVLKYKEQTRNYQEHIRLNAQSTHWMNVDETYATGYFTGYNKPNPNPTGILIGGWWWLNKPGHIFTIGGSRSGKGVNLVIPQLLNSFYKGSTLAIDPAAELAAITSLAQLELGKEVYILDPWETRAEIGADHKIPSSSFNPLDILHEGNPHLVDDCDMIAEALIPFTESGGNVAHFKDRARSLLSAYLMYMATHLPREKVNFLELRRLLRLDVEDRTRLLVEMSASDKLDGIIAQSGYEWLGMWESGAKEASGIYSTANSATEIFKSPQMVKSTQQSSFNIQDITKGNMTLYVCIPPARQVTHKSWLRLVIGASMAAVQRKPDKKVLFLMDEFPALGFMREIQKNMGQAAKYNLTLWPIVQDLNQMVEHYPKSWRTFMGNAVVTHFMGVNDQFTAEEASKLLGQSVYFKYFKKTFEVDKKSIEIRPLLPPEKVRQHDGIITIIQGHNPTWFNKSPYYTVDWMRQYAMPNPYNKGKEAEGTGSTVQHWLVESSDLDKNIRSSFSLAKSLGISLNFMNLARYYERFHERHPNPEDITKQVNALLEEAAQKGMAQYYFGDPVPSLHWNDWDFFRERIPNSYHYVFGKALELNLPITAEHLGNIFDMEFKRMVVKNSDLNYTNPVKETLDKITTTQQADQIEIPIQEIKLTDKQLIQFILTWANHIGIQLDKQNIEQRYHDPAKSDQGQLNKAISIIDSAVEARRQGYQKVEITI